MKNPKKPIVDFLLVGAQKSGTTTLHAYLQDHPEIGMATKKEIHFFNKDRYFESESPDYNAYHSFFDLNDSHKMRGEATPAYMYCRDAPKRIWQYNPDMKIIVILRNPIERAFSHWNMEVSRGFDELSFIEALRQESDRCREALPSQHYVYSYLDRGFYTSQIRELWRFFKKEQTLILKYEQLKNEPELIVSKLFNFLGVDNVFSKQLLLKTKVLHQTRYKTVLNDEAKALLIASYKHEILQLEHLLDFDCADWLESLD